MSRSSLEKNEIYHVIGHRILPGNAIADLNGMLKPALKVAGLLAIVLEQAVLALLVHLRPEPALSLGLLDAQDKAKPTPDLPRSHHRRITPRAPNCSTKGTTCGGSRLEQ